MALINTGGIIIGIKSAGEMASGVAVRLYRAGFTKIFMMEIPHPLAVRRTVSFCEAVHDQNAAVEGIESVLCGNKEAVFTAWKKGRIPVVVDPFWKYLSILRPSVLVDAVIAKKNLGTAMKDAPLVIGLGPGFTAGKDVHRVIETMRGHHLGRVIEKGSAMPNTGIPGAIGGHTLARVLRAPADGVFHSKHSIMDRIMAGEVVGEVGGQTIVSEIDGVLRGLIREGSLVRKGVKIGDIDPRGDTGYCHIVSDKARALGGAVLEAVMGGAEYLEEAETLRRNLMECGPEAALARAYML